MDRLAFVRSFALPAAALLGTLACIPAERTPDPFAEGSVVRLSDVYTADMLVDPAQVVEPARAEWRLAEWAEQGTAGWSGRAAAGIDGATVGAGGLTGTVAMPRSVVALEAPAPLGDGDRLHAIEVRMKVSGGKDLHATALGAEGPPAEAFAAPTGPPLALSTPLLPGDEVATYRIELANTMILGPLARTAPTRVVLRPSDAPGATFELESVRLVFHREHLAGVPSGLGWHGLGEVWRETLVSRPGERLVLPVTVPTERPVLDLAVGVPTDQPARFEVRLRPTDDGRDPGDEETRRLLQRTVTRADRWEEDRVDLAPWAGQAVELTLEIHSDAPGSVGLWGSPAVRSRRAPRLAGTPATGAGEAAAESTSPGPGKRPQGVVLVIVDTLRRDHLDAWGYERQTAPVLSALADDGVRFADTIAQSTWTKVSVPAILSSLYPTAHGVVDLSDRLPATADTLAESFRQAGYATMATSAWAFTGQMTNLHQGVELLYEGGSVDLPPGTSRTKTTRWFTDRVLEFVERHRDEPFFVTLHTGDPHSPYRPFDRYAELWSQPGADAWHAETLERARPHIEDPFFQNFELPTEDDLARAGIPLEAWRDHEVAWYDGSIRGVDTEMGRLVDRLEHLGLTDDVIVAVVADHGEEFFEQGMNWHGTNLYGPQTDVPFLLWGPGFVPAGVTVTEPVALIDVAPTLLSFASLPIPETAQGRDLTPLVAATEAGEAPSTRGFRVEPVFSERTTEGIERGFPRGTLPTSWAVSTAEWRLIRNPGAPEGVPELELYDRRTDPLSLTDVAADHPEVVERLAATLAGWRTWVEARKLDAESGGEVSAEELERLRSLGYL